MPTGETATGDRSRQVAINPGQGLCLGDLDNPQRAVGAAADPAAPTAEGRPYRYLGLDAPYQCHLLLRRELEGAPPLVGLLELVQQFRHGGGLDAAELGDDDA